MKCRYKYLYVISCDALVQVDVVYFIFSAQFAGLLCEEEGNGADNVQYCGYCKYHFSKLVSIGYVLLLNGTNLFHSELPLTLAIMFSCISESRLDFSKTMF